MTDDADFPRDDARALLRGLPGLRTSEVDFPAMIARGQALGWPPELVEANQALMDRGLCFDFEQLAPPYLRGTCFEDNVFFSFHGKEQKAGARGALEALARSLNVRIFEF